MPDIDIASLLRCRRKPVNFSELLGKTIIYIHKTEDVVLFICDDDTNYIQFHTQECCEAVTLKDVCADDMQYMEFHLQEYCESATLEDICGEFDDLLGTPIIHAEEAQTSDTGAYETSYTCTFYKLSTIKGSVTLRWYGTSNGYYSESVDFAQIITKDTTNV